SPTQIDSMPALQVSHLYPSVGLVVHEASGKPQSERGEHKRVSSVPAYAGAPESDVLVELCHVLLGLDRLRRLEAAKVFDQLGDGGARRHGARDAKSRQHGPCRAERRV